MRAEESLTKIERYAYNKVGASGNTGSCRRATEPSSNQRVAAPENQNPRPIGRGFSGAATQIRTGDLILTKDVLYQLSHSSISQEYFLVTLTIITKTRGFVNTFSKLFLEFCKNHTDSSSFATIGRVESAFRDLNFMINIVIAIAAVNASPTGTAIQMKS